MFIEGRRDDGDEVEIGLIGGQRGLVVLHIFDGRDTHYLRTASAADEADSGFRYSLVSSGGSEIDVLTRWIVQADSAARGLWYFLLTGDLDPGLAWDRLSEVPFAPGS